MENIEVGDVITMRKAHPCGSREWLVTRVGADIGLQCTVCGRRILLSRHDLAARMKGSPVKNPTEKSVN